MFLIKISILMANKSQNVVINDILQILCKGIAIFRWIFNDKRMRVFHQIGVEQCIATAEKYKTIPITSFQDVSFNTFRHMILIRNNREKMFFPGL